MVKRAWDNVDDPRFQGKISKTQDGFPRGEPPAEMSILNGLEVEYAMADDMAVNEALDEVEAKVQLEMSEDSTKLVPNQIRTQKRTPGLTAKDQFAYLLSQTHPNVVKMALPFFLTTTVFNGTTTELTISICHDNTAKIHNNPQNPIWFNRTFPFTSVARHCFPRGIGRGGVSVPKHTYLNQDGWVMIRGACVKPLRDT